MAFTRFYDDPCRIQKYLEETTNIGNYSLNVPGNGPAPSLLNDPHINMQKWGANLSQNKTDLESELHLLHRKLNKDSISENNYVDYLNTHSLYSQNSYNINSEEITAQSRATHPSWIYREINNFASEQTIPNNFNYLHLDPQDYYQLSNNFDVQRRITN